MPSNGFPATTASVNDLRELIDLWGGPDAVVNLRIMDGSWARAAMVRVQAEHAVALANSIVLLIENEMFIQCGPLIRQLWECGITGAWAAITSGAGDGLLAAADRSYAWTVKALASIDGNTDADAEDLLRQERKWILPSIEQRCYALDGGGWLYAYYRLLSQFSHGDGALFSHYIEEGEEREDFGHPWAFRDMRTFPYTGLLTALAVVNLHLALLAWDEVSEGHPSERALTAFAQARGIRSSLKYLRKG